MLASAVLMAGCKHTPPSGVAAEVNSRPITYAEVDKVYRQQFPNPSPEVHQDQVSLQKLEVLRSMIDAQIVFQRAEKGNLVAVDNDVDAKFNEIRAPYTQETFQKLLTDRKMTVDELKAQIRQDLSIAKVWNKEITSHISISDKDVSDYYEANKALFNWSEPQIRMAQILVTPHADASVRNLRTDKAQTPEQAKQKIEMILSRLKQGEDFAMLAQNFSEDPNSTASGGDMGFIPESALEQANTDLRKIVVALQPGQVSGIIQTPEGYRILKVVSKEPAGQRPMGDPRVQQEIRDTLLNRKDQLLKAVYYEIARNEASVVNYYAQEQLAKAQRGK